MLTCTYKQIINEQLANTVDFDLPYFRSSVSQCGKFVSRNGYLRRAMFMPSILFTIKFSKSPACNFQTGLFLSTSGKLICKQQVTMQATSYYACKRHGANHKIQSCLFLFDFICSSWRSLFKWCW
jgi:hypothetical protein